MPTRRGPKTAEELMRELNANPEYVARINQFEAERQRAIQAARQAMQPILEDLRAVGYAVDGIDDLRRSGERYADAIPILVKWLPRVENIDLKFAIVSALCVPWAKLEAAQTLIAEFEQAEGPKSDSLKWAIANALSIIADDTQYEEVARLVKDRAHGKAREMLALALGRMTPELVADLLIALLSDEEVAGHAVIALGQIRDPRAAQAIAPFLAHEKAWIRKEAKKALKRIARP